MKAFVNNDEMSHHDLSQNITNCGYLFVFAVFYLVPQFSTASPKCFDTDYRHSLSIGVKERLVDTDGVGELCTLCITGHNNGPLLGDSYPKSGERLNRKNGV